MVVVVLCPGYCKWQAQSVEFEAIRCVIRAMPEGATVFMSQCDGGGVS